MVHPSELHAGALDPGKPVIVRSFLFDDEHRKPIRSEAGVASRLEPRDDLTFGCEEPGRETQEAACPGSRCQHQPTRLVGGPIGVNDDAALSGIPVEHALSEPELCARLDGETGVSLHRSLSEEISAVRLRDPDRARLRLEGRKPLPELGRLEHGEREVVFRAGLERSTDERPRRGADLERAGEMQELRAGKPPELAPELVAAPKQRHVPGILVVGEPDDPRVPVHRAAGVGDVELLDPQHPPTAAREVVEGSAPHGADPDNDRVVGPAGRHS
jgi:hypothetical protein